MNYGTGNYSKGTARRLRRANAFNGLVVVLYGLCAAYYASVDWKALRPLVIAILTMMPLFLIPPLLHRVNDYAAILSIAVMNSEALALLAWMIFPSRLGQHRQKSGKHARSRERHQIYIRLMGNGTADC